MNVVPRAWSIYLAKMLDVDLDNELPDEWRQEAVKKVPHENTPYLLWDRADEIERELLANPEVAKKMVTYLNQLISTCNTEYLPNLSHP